MTYVFRRLATALLLLLLVLTASFFLLHSLLGDPFATSRDMPEDQRAALRQLWGLDRPLLSQYASWIRGVMVEWDWGLSIRYRRPVGQVLGEALPNTCLLAVAAFLVQYLCGTLLGALSALNPRSRLGQATDTGALLLYSIPTFWLALVAILLFSREWALFPPSHMHSPGAEDFPPMARLGDLLWHLALPAVVLGLSPMAAVLRFTRKNVEALLDEEPVRAARARGVSEARVLGIHVLKPASRPLTQLLGLSLPGLMSGALVVEVIFSWPGLGSVAMEGLMSRDYPLLLATTAWSGAVVILGSLLADLLLLAVDPRTRSD